MANSLHIRTAKRLLLGGLFAVLFAAFITDFQNTPYQYPPLLHFPKMLPTDNFPTVEGVELGRFLFYDPILSSDSTFSCSTCHQQKYAFSDAPKAFSKGINGDLGQRNTMPLFNLPWYTAFFWDGSAKSIEAQVFRPVSAHDEMDLSWRKAAERIRNSRFYKPKFTAVFGREPIDSVLISKAIAQFERTLISHNSKYDEVLRGEKHFTAKEFEGFELMNDQTKGNCLHCHTTDANALGTTAGFSNNGLDNYSKPSEFQDKGKGKTTGKLSDIGLFKIPSLRNVAVTPPYMHDGRFQSLEAVLNFYSRGVQNSFNIDSKMEIGHRAAFNLTTTEEAAIIAFLHTLTDSVFLNNPAFSNPFIELSSAKTGQ